MEDDICVPACLGAAYDTWLHLWRLNSAKLPLAFHYPLVKYSFGSKMIKTFIAALKWGLFSEGFNDLEMEMKPGACVSVGVRMRTCKCVHKCLCRQMNLQLCTTSVWGANERDVLCSEITIILSQMTHAIIMCAAVIPFVPGAFTHVLHTICSYCKVKCL